jgi:hypothetical protein
VDGNDGFDVDEEMVDDMVVEEDEDKDGGEEDEDEDEDTINGSPHVHCCEENLKDQRSFRAESIVSKININHLLVLSLIYTVPPNK